MGAGSALTTDTKAEPAADKMEVPLGVAGFPPSGAGGDKNSEESVKERLLGVPPGVFKALRRGFRALLSFRAD